MPQLVDGRTLEETRETAKGILIGVSEEIGIETLSTKMHDRIVD